MNGAVIDGCFTNNHTRDFEEHVLRLIRDFQHRVTLVEALGVLELVKLKLFDASEPDEGEE